MAANGVRQGRISDEWNDIAGWRKTLAHRHGCRARTHPEHHLLGVAQAHRRILRGAGAPGGHAAGGANLLQGPRSGLLTPDRTRVLVPLIKENIGGIPLEFHTHCTTGLGPLCALEAIRQGIRIINTALPPLANGSSNPSLFNVAANARSLGYETAVDEEVLRPVSEYFTEVAAAGGPAHRRAGGIRLQPVPAPGAGGHDLEPAPPTRPGGPGRPHGTRPGRGGAGARGAGLPHHGDAAVPVRGQPGGHQHHSWGSATRRSPTR